MVMQRRARLMMAAMLVATPACSPKPDQAANESANAMSVTEPEVAPANISANESEAPAAANAAEPETGNVTAAEAAKAEDAKKPGDADKAEEAKPTVAAASPAAPAAPPAAFARCVVCHDVKKGGPDRLGPNLFGTYGKPAGTHGSFAYSAALKGSGLKWDDATLDKWLDDPKGLVPGNRMIFPGLKDAAKRKEIVDYLKTLQ